MLLILMPARDMVCVVKQVDWEGCAVPEYFRRERNQCLVLCLCPQAHQRRLSFFPLRGLDWRRVAGGDSRVLCRSPHLSQLKYQEKQAEASPRFPFAAGKWFPCVARGAASGGCSLGVAKAKCPWGWFALFACSKAPLLGVFFSCAGTGLRGPGEADGSLLYLQNGDLSMYQCNARAGCDCCCSSTSGNIAGA